MKAQRRVLLGVAALVAVALGGIVLSLRSGVQPGPVDRTGSSPTVASPTPTASPLTNPDARSAAEFRSIYRQLEDTTTRALVERRPELIDEVFSPACDRGCLREDQKRVITEMLAADARAQGYGPRVLVVLVNQADVPGVIFEGEPTRGVSIRVVDEQGPYAFVHPDGSIIEQSPGWAPRSSEQFLYFSRETSSWRIASRTLEGPAEDILGPEWRAMVDAGE
jgi:hypothetical protein